LLEGGVQGVRGVGVADLRLHHHQGDAVHEQDDVRDDTGLHAAGRVDPELVDGVEPVALRVGEVDEPHDRVNFAGHLVAVHLGLEEQGLSRFIRFEQGPVGLPKKLVSKVVELLVGEPGLAVLGDVGGPDSVSEHLGQDPLAEPSAEGRRGI
jgi:hypothetical protein